MAENNDNNLNDLIVLYACGKLEPEIAAEFEKDLQKRPDWAARVKEIQLLDRTLTEALGDDDDIDDDLDDIVDNATISENSTISVAKSLMDKPTSQSLIDQTKPRNDRFLAFTRVAGNVAALALFAILGFALFSKYSSNNVNPQLANNEKQNTPNSNTGNVPEASSVVSETLTSNPLGGNFQRPVQLNPSNDNGSTPAQLKEQDSDQVQTDQGSTPNQKDEQDSDQAQLKEQDSDQVQTDQGSTQDQKDEQDSDQAQLVELVKSMKEKYREFENDIETDDLQLKTLTDAKQKFYSLLNDIENDISNAKAEDVQEISNVLTPDIIGEDAKRKEFKEDIDKIAYLLKSLAEKN